jgi:hypothetical protein
MRCVCNLEAEYCEVCRHEEECFSYSICEDEECCPEEAE